MAISAAQTWYNRTGAGVSELNGGGWDPTVSSPGTNRADQDSPQVTFNGTTVTGTTSGVSANVVITGVATDGTEVGNTLRIASGTNFTAGYYTIVSVSTGISGVGAWTLDRNCSSGAASAMVGRMGGAHAFLTNLANGGTFATPILSSPLLPGHTIYVRSAGSSANPSIGGTADYDYSAGYLQFPSGDMTNGMIHFVGLGASEAIPTGTNFSAYRPLIKTTGLWLFGASAGGSIFWDVVSFKVFCKTSPSFTNYGLMAEAGFSSMRNCIWDMNGQAVGGVSRMHYSFVTGNWFCNTGATTADTQSCIDMSAATAASIYDNLVTDVRGPGILTSNGTNIAQIKGNICANCHAEGFKIDGASGAQGAVANNTAYNCTGDAFSFTVAALRFRIINNTSSKIPSGKFAYKVAGTLANNDRIKVQFDYNNAYLDGGAGGLYSGITAGSHDTNVDPIFTDPTSATYNFGVGTNLASVGIGQISLASGDATVSYVDIGAAQRVASAGSAGMLFIPDMAAT